MPLATRRDFLAGASMTAVSIAATKSSFAATAADSPFHISVISDEISQDFDHACSVIANDFGLEWVELREIGGKNLQKLTESEVADAQKTLTKYKMKVNIFLTCWLRMKISRDRALYS